MSDFVIEPVVLGHPRFRAAGAAAAWLWTQCGIWSASEDADGFVPVLTVRAYGTLSQARRLVEVELWEEADGGYRFLRWRDHMGSPEDPKRERKREQDRERQRRLRAQAKGDVSPVADVAATSRRHRGDIENQQSGLDTPSSNKYPPVVPPRGDEDRTPQAAQPEERRKRRLAPDWVPNEVAVKWATDARLDAAVQAEEFRDFHGARGTTMLDWDLAFRTWLRNAVKFRAQRGVSPQKPNHNAWLEE